MAPGDDVARPTRRAEHTTTARRSLKVFGWVTTRADLPPVNPGFAGTRPSTIYVAEDGAREVAEQLIRDAGYDPISTGGIEQAHLLEDSISIFSAIRKAGLGTYFHRYAKPGEL
jgi:hypothetical protein